MSGVSQETQGTSIPTTSPAAKKTRLNPARRKAAKAKTDVQNPAGTKPAPITKDESGTSSPAKSVEQISPAPKPLVRTKTTPPAILDRQGSDTLPTASKPVLTRTRTAPQTGSKARSLALATPALVTGGLVGCAAGAAILLGVGIWYDFSGAESAILTAKAAKLCVDNLAEELITSLKVGTYSADEALDMLRRTTLAYASTIPEGAPFVERIFREIDMVRKQRGREVDKVVAETYTELSKAGRKGAKPADMQRIVLGQLLKLSSFASKATQDVVARNPKLRPFRDETIKSLNGPPETKVPTLRVNMAVRQKQAVGS
jgi:hypothetical protein